MVSVKYAGALALSTLLGCSTPNESSSDWVSSPPPSALEESVMNSYLSSGSIQGAVDPFYGKRVSLLYPTNDGPISGNNGYTGGRPNNPGLVDAVRTGLNQRKAYVSEEGVFGRNYQMRIDLSRRSNMNPADFVVVADENPALDAGLKNVYFVEKNGNEYKLVEVKGK